MEEGGLIDGGGRLDDTEEGGPPCRRILKPGVLAVGCKPGWRPRLADMGMPVPNSYSSSLYDGREVVDRALCDFAAVECDLLGPADDGGAG